MSFTLPGLTMPAYFLRYRLEYLDINEVLTRVDIAEAIDMNGLLEIERVQAEPVTITWGDDTAVAPILYGSTIKLNWYSETDYQYLGLYTGDPEKWKITYYKGGVFKGQWFALPEQWQEPLTHPPYPVSFEGADGLANLRNIPFEDADGNFFTGRRSLLEVLATCLQQTHLELSFNTAIDYHEDSHNPANDTLTQTFVDVGMYEGMTCGEVLESVFAECRIYQRDGMWWVVSNTNYVRNSFTYFRYNKNGAFVLQSTCNNLASGWQMEGLPMLEIQPALKHVDVVQNLGLKDSMLENANFEAVGSVVTGWTGVGVTPKSVALNDEGGNYLFLEQSEDPANTENMSKYAYQSLAVPAFDQSILLRFRYAVAGPEDTYSYLFWRLELTGSGKTYYAARVESNEADGVYWKFFDLDQKGVTHNELRNQPVKYLNHRVVNVERVAPVNYPRIQDSFQPFEILIQGGVPIAGTLTLRLYVPWIKIGGPFIGSCFAGLELRVMQNDKTNYPTTEITRATVNSRNIYKHEIKLSQGDLPSFGTLLSSYAGYLSLANNDPTFAWRRHGGASLYSYAEIIARMAASRSRRPQHSIRLTLNSMQPGQAMVIEDTYNADRRFVESGITLNDRMLIVEGQWVELLPVDLVTGIEVTEVTEIKDSDIRQTVKGGTKPPPYTEVVNTDERVALADPVTGDRSGVPGFLDEDYYDVIEVEETVIYRPKQMFIKINFSNTATPTVSDYQANYKAVFGEYPIVRLFTEAAAGKDWERQEKPVYNRTGGLLASIVFDLSSEETGYIILSR